MSPERAFNIVLDAAVLQWSANTKQSELREALDRVLEQLGEYPQARIRPEMAANRPPWPGPYRILASSR
jgi:hypothetical protein